MIPQQAIITWSLTHPWSTPEQVEQDLILSRAICMIAADSYLGEELTFRGGTALHKLHLPQALRYSEDLDYTRSTEDGVGRVLDTLKDIGRTLGFVVKSELSEHPKVIWRTLSESGMPLRIKIEINTHERLPTLPIITLPFQVTSSWWTGNADVRTFQLAELMATKLRALYQRSKGRDLFDLWLALTVAHVDPAQIVAAFAPYRPVGYTAKSAVVNLKMKLADEKFRHDLDPLTVLPPSEYDVDQAGLLVMKELLVKV